MLHLDLPHAHAQFFYHFLMTLALVVPFGVAWVSGLKKGFPAATWLTVLGILFGSGILGARLGAFHAEEWAALFQHGEWQNESPKTVVGSAVVLLLAYQILKKWFRLPASAADALVLGLPLGAVIGRMACLVAGCCYGTPSGGWWSIRFGPESSAFGAQVASGLIEPGAPMSLPLHPVQLDLLIANLLIFSGLCFFKKKFRPGELALAGLSAIAMARFGSEFFRDIATNRGATGQLFLGLKAVQWLALLVLAGCFLTYFFGKKGAETGLREQPLLRLSLLIFPLSVLLWLFRLRLGMLETLVFMCTFTPAIAAVMLEIWKNERRNWVKWPSAALLSGAMALQVVVQADSIIGPQKRPVLPEKAPRNWWEFGTGLTALRYRDYDATVTGSGCDAKTTVHRDRTVIARSIGVEGAFHHLAGDAHISAGGRLGFSQSEVLDGFPVNSGRSTVGGLFFSADERFVGGSLGLMVVPDKASAVLGRKVDGSGIKPSWSLRLGSAKKYSFDVAVRERQQFLFYPKPDFSVGLVNWGFNDPTGQTWVRLGIAAHDWRESALAFGAFRLPVWQLRASVEGGVYASDSKYFALSFGIKYHFPVKK